MFGLVPIHLFVVTLFLGLLGLAVVSDVASLRIPNRICLAIIFLYPVYVLSSPEPVNWLSALAVAATVFAVGIIPFVAGVMGGGDVKLLAAAALWAGPALIADFLLVTGIAGGVIALVMVTNCRFVVASALEALGANDARDAVLGRAIPYGVAIAVGGFVAIGPPVLGG